MEAISPEPAPHANHAFIRPRYATRMPTDHHSPAELVHSLHQPWRASLAECLARWQSLDHPTRARSFLVLHGEAGARRTLAAPGIAALAAEIS